MKTGYETYTDEEREELIKELSGCNIHLEFKRLDLVKRLNFQAAGSNELGDDS